MNTPSHPGAPNTETHHLIAATAQHLPLLALSLAVTLLVALLVAIAAAHLGRLDGRSLPASLLHAATAFAATTTLGLATLALITGTR